MMKAYIICSNNSIEGVAIDDAKKAREIMNKLARQDYVKFKKTFKTRRAYNFFADWHIHEMDVL